MSAQPSASPYVGADGARIEAALFLPTDGGDAPRGGVVLVHDLEGPASARPLAAALAAAGLPCLLPDLWSREGRPADVPAGAGRWSLEARLPDRRALEDLDRAVGHLGNRDDVLDDGVGALGLGMGGTLAFLLGCTSRAVAAVACFGGRMLYPELSTEKPVQPLELLLNLDRPLLALAAVADPELPPAHLALWSQKLDAAGKDHELVVYPGGLPPLDDAALLRRLVGFFGERL